MAKTKKISFKDRLMKVHRFYGVEILFLEPKINKVQYVLECDYLGYRSTVYQYRISRQKMYVNGQELTNTMDVLAEKCMDAVYPLVLNVGFAGKILGPANLEEITNRWENLKKKLSIEYKGVIAHDYLNRISTALSSDQIFIEKMEKDVIFNILIPRLYIWGSSSLEKDNVIIKIPHPNNSCMLSFKGKQEMSPYPDEHGCVNVSYHGNYAGNTMLESDNDIQGSLFLKHFLDNENSSMIRMFGRCEIKGRQNYKVEYKIIRLREKENLKV